jgi:coiled-coil-helix-coiled-coil-helix domain-containing protein 2
MPAQMQPQAQSGGFLSGIGSTIMTGMAFGAGSEVAHQAVRSLTGGGSHGQEAQQQQPQPQQAQQSFQGNPCQMEMDNFSRCLSSNDNLQYCQSYSDVLKSCKQSNNLL